ncbi:Methanogenesis regulatory histidine kinase FilI [uncultured archaeon]|nr:Methanogenesis regulatory histidine kinase FilI [uncultured archaeon]
MFDRMFGCGPGEMIGRKVTALYAMGGERSPQEQVDAINSALRSHKVGVWRGEVRNIRKDGTPFWCYMSVSAFDHPDYGKVWLSIRTDITERKEAEGAMRLQSKIMKNLSEGVQITTARDMAIVYTNPRFDEMFGYNAGELIGKDVSILNAPAGKSPQQTAREIQAALRKSNAWRGEIRNIRKDGTPFWCHVSISAFAHPDYGDAWLSIHADISELKKAEIALKASEGRNNAILKADPDMMFRINRRGVFLSTNYDMDKRFFVPPSQFLGKRIGQVLPKPIADMAMKHMEKTLKTRRMQVFTYSLLIKGEMSYFEARMAVFGPNEVLAIVSDVSERKRAEEALLAERRKVEELSIAKEEFMDAMTHELKTPLSVILTTISLLGKSAARAGPDQREELAMAERNALRLRRTVDYMLTIRRIESLRPNRANVDLGSLLRDIHEEYLPLASMKGLDLTLRVQDGRIVGDAELLRMALSNFVSNAVKFTEKGFVRVSAAGGKDGVAITVSDSGIGIPRRHHARLFEKFFKANPAAAGSGMGLWLASKIVGMHGGRIAFSSAEGKGSRFTITLPRGG